MTERSLPRVTVGPLGAGGEGDPGSAGGGAGGEAGSGAGGTGGGTAGFDPTTREVVEVEITDSQTLVTAECPEDTYRIGGGCDCGDDGNITLSRASNDEGWSCACDVAPESGTPRAYAVCSPTAFDITVVTTAITAADQATAAICPDEHVVIAGGISCGDALSNSANASYPESTGYWVGECDDIGTNPTVYAYCIAADVLSDYTVTWGAVSQTLQRMELTCANGYALAAGCDCGSSWELNGSAPVEDGEDSGWMCDCNGTSSASANQYLMCLVPDDAS